MSRGHHVRGAQRQQGHPRCAGVSLRVIAFVVGALFAAAAPAMAYWTLGVTATGSYSAAIADSLNGGNTPTLGGIDGENVTLNWAQSTIVHDGQAATGYTITRYNAATGGTATAATGGCAGTVAALTCTEQNVTPGNWWYTVTPLYHAWTGTDSGRLAVTVSAPTFSITSGQSLAAASGGTITGGMLAHFGNTENVAFHLDSAGGTLLTTSPATVTTSGSGSASITGITIPSGLATGLHRIVVVGATSGLTATSNTFDVYGAATKLVLTAQTNTPTTGAPDKLSITAEDAGNNTVTSYAGSKNLTFGGASTAPDGTQPTVTNSSGTAVKFGTTTAITFTNGVAQVFGAGNGLMTLYKAETALITVSDGTINNGTGLSVTVGAGSASNLAWTSPSASKGTLGSPCLFTCTVTGLGNFGTFSAKVSVTDSHGNIVSNLGTTPTVTVSTPTNTSGGSFTAPTSGSTVTLTVPATGPATSTTSFTYSAGNANWTSDAIQATTTGSPPYTSIATVTKLS
jgi:hypothetical protein